MQSGARRRGQAGAAGYTRRGAGLAAAAALLALLAGHAGLAGAAQGDDPVAKEAFGALSAPAPGPAEPLGAHARGCLAGAVQLAETGPSWQGVRLSRNRHWGHPEMIAFIGRLGAAAQAAGWPRLFVGDISQPRGGPMRTGHRSHQIGLDADIWLRRPPGNPISRTARESVKSLSMVAPDRASLTADWTPAHHAVIRAAAADPAVARIFVNAAIKARLCRDEPAGPGRDWLRRVRPWWGHDAHFHVRLACPAGAPGCVDQDVPPPGDGCGAGLDWWFTEEALSPPPRKGPEPGPLRLSDLPPGCAALAGG